MNESHQGSCLLSCTDSRYHVTVASHKYYHRDPRPVDGYERGYVQAKLQVYALLLEDWASIVVCSAILEPPQPYLETLKPVEGVHPLLGA